MIISIVSFAMTFALIIATWFDNNMVIKIVTSFTLISYASAIGSFFYNSLRKSDMHRMSDVIETLKDRDKQLWGRLDDFIDSLKQREKTMEARDKAQEAAQEARDKAQDARIDRLIVAMENHFRK
jgi:hypothetical protein